jgi:hypothetical protein
MAQKWEYIPGIIAGLVGLILTVDLAANIVAESTRMPTHLDATRLLLQEQIVLPLGPLILAATPFQLAYCILSICLTCLAILVCLANSLFCRRSAS